MASGNKAASNVASIQDALAGGAARLMRLVEPPPAGFPPGPSGDQAVNLLLDPLTFLRETTARHGSVVGMLLGTERVVLVTDKGAARQVLVDQADVFIKEGTAFFPGSSLAGNGLLVSDGDVWRRQRRLSNPAFRRSAIDAYAAAMVRNTQALLSTTWCQGGTRDVYADFNALTLEITLEALFGFEMDRTGGGGSGGGGSSAGGGTSPTECARADAIVGAVAKAFEFFTRRAGSAFTLPEWVPTLDNLEFGAAVAQLDAVVYDIIDERRREMQAGGRRGGGGAVGGSALSARSDLLQALISATDDEGTGMTDTALRDELMTMLVAGQETSAILLGWASALLAHNPTVQDALRDEVDNMLCGAPPSAADVRRLPRVEAVVLEALRLFSPAYMVGRCACRDATIGDHVLPAGTTVLVSPYILHRDPEHWERPDEFLPQRWAPLQAAPGYQGGTVFMSNVGEAVNGAYVPFGAGPRNCIGTGFAMMEAILVIASVVQRYRLEPSSSSRAFPQPKPLITLRPEAVPLLILPRDG